MFAIEQIGVIILLSGFILELFIAIILYPKGDLIKDMLANLVIGVGVLIAGLLMKFVALSIYSFTYHFSFLTPKVFPRRALVPCFSNIFFFIYFVGVTS